jgi:hypothetical protein
VVARWAVDGALPGVLRVVLEQRPRRRRRAGAGRAGRIRVGADQLVLGRRAALVGAYLAERSSGQRRRLRTSVERARARRIDGRCVGHASLGRRSLDALDERGGNVPSRLRWVSDQPAQFRLDEAKLRRVYAPSAFAAV